MVNLRREEMPVSVAATETVPKSHTKYQNNICVKHDIKELQKTASPGTTHVLRKLLMQNYKHFIVRNNIMCTTNCNRRIFPKFYTLDTGFVHLYNSKYRVCGCKNNNNNNNSMVQGSSWEANGFSTR